MSRISEEKFLLLEMEQYVEIVKCGNNRKDNTVKEQERVFTNNQLHLVGVLQYGKSEKSLQMQQAKVW